MEQPIKAFFPDIGIDDINNILESLEVSGEIMEVRDSDGNPYYVLFELP